MPVDDFKTSLIITKVWRAHASCEGPGSLLSANVRSFCEFGSAADLHQLGVQTCLSTSTYANPGRELKPRL